MQYMKLSQLQLTSINVVLFTCYIDANNRLNNSSFNLIHPTSYIIIKTAFIQAYLSMIGVFLNNYLIQSNLSSSSWLGQHIALVMLYMSDITNTLMTMN